MKVIADTHVHFYPCYDMVACIQHAVRNMSAFGIGGHIARVLCLTERYDCAFFERIADGGIRIPECGVVGTQDAGALVLDGEFGRLYLVAGRQIITRERIEVLALGLNQPFPDAQPIDEVLPQVRERGALPVLSWAPGKWFFERGSIVQRIISQSKPGDVLLGDTTLRPGIWPTPSLFEMGEEKGLRLIAGSDPLPFRGEEKQIGKYVTVLEGNFVPEKPSTSIRAMLSGVDTQLALEGERGGALGTLMRLRKNAHAKRS